VLIFLFSWRVTLRFGAALVWDRWRWLRRSLRTTRNVANCHSAAAAGRPQAAPARHLARQGPVGLGAAHRASRRTEAHGRLFPTLLAFPRREATRESGG